jgi:predicted phosphodiesterase
MKIAVLADIHANLPALQTVIDHVDTWHPHMVIVGGDVVNRGPRPAECLDLILQWQKARGWLLLRGNHEDYVIDQGRPHPAFNEVEAEIYRNSLWTYQKLNCDVRAIASWPDSLSYSIQESELRAAHASMRGNRDGIYAETDDSTLRAQIGWSSPGLFATAHTHKPLVRLVDDTLVVNAGAVGLPFDGDPRAAYAQLLWQGGAWRAAIVRVDYDRQQAERDFVESGLLEEGGALARLMRVELKVARSQLAEWTTAYESRVLAGELGLDRSVDRFLEEQGIAG